ncbi:hypothetical protein EDB84DRAFT_1189665 [Lactarius hengduanensis]|nr:hypothetical protein EDB84DRAFT_1189665 [Lactarius hengduanensis]
MMSLSVSSFPEAHSRLTTNPTWGEGSSSTTKRWFFGGRLNTGGVSFMKGIRHIGKVQLKSSVARRAPNQNSSPPLPPRFSVRASTIVIDIIAVPHDDGRQSSADINHGASIPSPIPWPRWRAVPLLVSNPRPRAISSGAGGGAASATAQQLAIRVDSEAARAAREGPETEEIGPVADHPIVILTPADGSDITHVLLRGDSNLLRRETRTTTHKRSLSSPSGKHMGSRTRDQSPPSTLPLLSSMHIARLRSGSRPTPTPLPSLLAATERRPKTAPTARATKPIPPMPLRRPEGDSNGSPSNMPRSRSQPQLRTAAAVTTGTGMAKAAVEQPMPSRFRAGSPTISAKTHEALQPCMKQRNAPAVRASPQGAERRPRTAPETGYAARPLALVGGTDHGAAWEMRGMGVAVAHQRAARPRMPYGPRTF